MQRDGNLGRWVVGFIGVLALAAAGGLALSIRNSPQGPSVVVYTALDEEFSRPVFEQFTAQTGIRVLAKYDTESTKSVGLTQALFAERCDPAAMCFGITRSSIPCVWSATVCCKKGTVPCTPTSPRNSARRRISGADLQPGAGAVGKYRPGPCRRVADGFGRLVRSPVERPGGNCQAAGGDDGQPGGEFVRGLGGERAENYFRRLHANARTMGGNKQVARGVATGELAFGLTDTDDGAD